MICVVINIVLSLVYPLFIAARTAAAIKNGDYQRAVDVQFRSFSSSAGQVTEYGLQPIGSTQRAVSFYDDDDKRTIVIPQAQVVSIKVP